MTQDLFESLCSARDALCQYCGKNGPDCENCVVPTLLDQAANKAREANCLDYDI